MANLSSFLEIVYMPPVCLLHIPPSYTEFKERINILGKAWKKKICHRLFLLVISVSFFSSQADISIFNSALFEITKVWNSHPARNKNSLAQTTNRERGVSVIKISLLYYLDVDLSCHLRLLTELDSQKHNSLLETANPSYTFNLIFDLHGK